MCIRDRIKRGGDQIQSLEMTIVKLSTQIDAAEKRSAEGVHKVSETITELRQRFSSTDETGTEGHEQLQAAVAEVSKRTEKRITDLQNSFEDMVSRLEQSQPSTPSTDKADSDAINALGEFEEDDFDVLNDDTGSVIDLDGEADGLAEDEFSVDLDEDLTTETATESIDDDDILSQVCLLYTSPSPRDS